MAKPKPKYCECNDRSLDHAAGRCSGRWLERCERDGVEVWLCCDCVCTGDVRLDVEVEG